MATTTYHIVTPEERRRFVESLLADAPPQPAATTTSDDDDDDQSPPPLRDDNELIVHESVPTPCPLCHEEMPYIDDAATATAMAERVSDLRRVIFRFEKMLTGRLHDEMVFWGMLELRRLFIEHHLETYSSERFHRWTMQMLRNHYHPRTGHRFVYVRALTAQIEELEETHVDLKRHYKFQRNPETGEREFNARFVPLQIQLVKGIAEMLKTKESALRLGDTAADMSLVIEAIDAVRATRRPPRGATSSSLQRWGGF